MIGSRLSVSKDAFSGPMVAKRRTEVNSNLDRLFSWPARLTMESCRSRQQISLCFPVVCNQRPRFAVVTTVKSGEFVTMGVVHSVFSYQLTHLASTYLLYADPGSGTLVWQLLLAAFFGLMFYFRRLKDFLGHRKKEGTRRQD